MTGSAHLPPGLPSELGDVALLLGELPGIGSSTSVKLATFLAQTPELAQKLGTALRQLPLAVGPCSRCNFLTKRGELCAYCQDWKRDDHLLCVVERVRDVSALEKGSIWRGRYFVLGKLVSPLEEVGAADLPIAHLVQRVWEMARLDGGEVLLALPSTTDGDATALVLAHHLRKEIPDVVRPKITRIGKGVSTRADLADADQITIGHAVAARASMGGEP